MATEITKKSTPKKNFSIRFDGAQDDELSELENLGLPKAAVVRLCVGRSLPTIKKIVDAFREAGVEVDEDKIREVVEKLRPTRQKTKAAKA